MTYANKIADFGQNGQKWIKKGIIPSKAAEKLPLIDCSLREGIRALLRHVYPMYD